MYCPICSTKASLDQKFCRVCGFSVEKIAQAVGEQLPAKLDENLEQRKNKLERLGVATLSVFGLGILGLFLYMVGYKLLSQGMVVAALGVIGALVILGSGLVSVFLFAKAKEIQDTASKRRLPSGDEIRQTEMTTNLLSEGDPKPVSSVTEHTTEILFTEKKRN